MWNIKTLYLFVILLAFVACNGEKKGPLHTDESAEVEVSEIAARFNKAMIDPKEDVLDRITADNLSYGHSSGLLQNKAEFIDDLLNGPFDFISIDAQDQSIQISGDVAVVRQIFNSEALNAGTPTHIQIGVVLIFQKQEDQWRLLARQAFKL